MFEVPTTTCKSRYVQTLLLEKKIAGLPQIWILTLSNCSLTLLLYTGICISYVSCFVFLILTVKLVRLSFTIALKKPVITNF